MSDLPPGVVEVNGKFYAKNHLKALGLQKGSLKPRSDSGVKVQAPTTPRQATPKGEGQTFEYGVVEFSVPGNPVPKGRPRVVDGATFTPKRTAQYERKVRILAQLAMRGRDRFEFEVSVDVTAVFDDHRRRDLDNIFKSASDAMNGIVYDDDSQITEIYAIKRTWDKGTCDPHLSVTVTGKVAQHLKGRA